jgi:ferredoxin-NADP reductase
VTNKQDAIGHKLIEVSIPPEVAAKYIQPGQYVQFERGSDRPGFYAIATPPGRDIFRFLIKETNCNKILTDAPIGSELTMSDPLGQVCIPKNFIITL